MPPRIDILLPFRNAADTLSACLDSIAAQTFADWRLVMVDDGSADASAAVARDYAKTDSRVLLIPCAGRGLVAALNTGLSRIDAPLVARMDADDVMHPRRLERQAAYLTTRPEIGAAGCRVETDGFDGGFSHYLAWSNALTEPDDIACARFIESPMVHPAMMFRRELVDLHGGYRDGDFPEDYELWLRWMDAGVRFAKVPDVLMRWNDGGGRLTRRDPRYRVDAFWEVKAGYLVRWLDRHSTHGRRVQAWGAGPATRKRLRILLRHGIVIENLIDIDPDKIGRSTPEGPVSGPDALPGPDTSFVLSAVGSRGAREKIRRELIRQGYREGESFLCIA